MMRQLFRWLAGIILCGAILSLASASSPGVDRKGELLPLPAVRLAQVKGDWSKVKVVLQASLPSSPREMMVYRVVYPRADGDYVNKLSRAFVLDSRVEQGPDSLMVRSEPRALEVYPATGAFWFKDTSALWSGKKPSSLPSETAGVEIAERFLRNYDLLPKGMAFESTGHSTLKVYDVASGQTAAYDTDLHVNFRLSVVGIPVAGPGGKIKVYLGEGSRLIGLYWAGFDVQPHKPYPLISAAKAVSLLEEHGVVTTVKQPRKVTISEVSLVYYAQPGLEVQEYLEPVYRFRGEVEGEEGSEPYLQYVPAIEGKYLKPLPASSEDSPPRGK